MKTLATLLKLSGTLIIATFMLGHDSSPSQLAAWRAISVPLSICFRSL